MRFPLVIVAVAAVVLGTSACSSDTEPPAPTAAPTSSATTSEAPGGDGPRYVALGDSFTAGPGIDQADTDSGTCSRSTNNYPNLVAEKIKAASFDDVSCSGATTENVLEDAPIFGISGEDIPAQLDAVKADTQLVTLTIGGNDENLFSHLAQACTQQQATCSTFLDQELPTTLTAVEKNVARTLRAITTKAPEAQVILVGYLGVSSDGEGCQNLGGTALDTSKVAQGESSIDQTLAAAAKAADTTYVSMNAASQGHDACAGKDAWTNGISPEKSGDGISLHPKAAGMRAVAADVESAIQAA